MELALPRGEVAFLFTDIEGSSRLWERDRAAMTSAVARHDALLAAAVAQQQGALFKHVGDMVQAAFHTPQQAVAAAVAAQRALAAEPWPLTGPIRVRMGVHLGEAAPNARGDYNQIACLNRLSRMMSAGHGGQVLLSDAVRGAVQAGLPAGVTLRDLGRHRLRDLPEAEQISQLVITGLPETFPPLKSQEGFPSNLPHLATPLIGREREMAEIIALLSGSDTRLLTLLGPGGVGKTHLALSAATELRNSFPDGVWLISLGDVSHPDLILPTVAATLGVREGGGLDLREALWHWLGGRTLLLVLDNCEQVIAGAVDVAEMLRGAPNVRILATSRQRLAVAGERTLPVLPLPLDTDGAAVRLFLARARENDPALPRDQAELAAIAAICARLDGLPLAIELATAHLRHRSLSELLADLDHRFSLLVGGRRDALAHQHSLEATIAWSYDRLPPEQQQLLRQLSLFAGGWSRDAAQALGDGLEQISSRLDALVEESLIQRRTLAHDESRWTMLESIRSFARERLDTATEAAAAHDRHAAWCLRFAQEAAGHLDGAAQQRWLDRVDLEHDNARVALGWRLEQGDGAAALALATALAGYWQTRGYLSEGRHWLERALALAPDNPAARLDAFVEIGILAQEQGDFAAAGQRFREALELARAAGDQGRASAMLSNLGAVALEQGDLPAAERCLLEGLHLAESGGDQRRRLLALGNLGALAHYRDDLPLALRHYSECANIWRSLGDERGLAAVLLNMLLLLAPLAKERVRARATGEECLRRFRALGDRQGEALTLAGLSLIALLENDFTTAEETATKSLYLAREIADRSTEARALANLAIVSLERGEHAAATAHLLALVHASDDLGDQDGIASALLLAASILSATGKAEDAARLLGATMHMRDTLEIATPPELRERNAALAAELEQRLGERFAPLVHEGHLLAPVPAVLAALDPPRASNPFAALDDLLGIDPSTFA